MKKHKHSNKVDAKKAVNRDRVVSATIKIKTAGVSLLIVIDLFRVEELKFIVDEVGSPEGFEMRSSAVVMGW